MRSEDLIYLAGVAALAKDRYSSTQMSLRAAEGTITASYTGSYTAGSRSVLQPKDVQDFELSVECEVFAGLCSVLGERESVRVTATDKKLDLKSRSHSVTVRGARYEQLEVPEVGTDTAVVDADLLKAELNLAKDFADAHKNKAVNLTFKQNALRLISFNGNSALFLSQLECKAGEPVTVVAPVEELSAGTGLVGPGLITVSVIKEGRNILLTSKDAWYRCASSNSVFPKLDDLMKQHPRTTAIISAIKLQQIAKSVKALKAQRFVLISGTSTPMIMRTANSEYGQFSVDLEGDFAGEQWFDNEVLQLAGKLGEVIELQLGESRNVPAFVMAGKRAVWLMGAAVTE